MHVPPVNLRPILQATEPAWRERLSELFARMHFILGPQLEGFEEELSAAFGAREAIGVGTGTAAIELCLRAARICTPQQEVITSALTAPFTGIGIAGAGPKLRLADVDPETLLLDADDAGNRASRKTAAIVPVHLYGQPCEMTRLRAVARTLRAVLIQDACQAHGAQHKGKPLTRYSPYVCYSFYPTKNLGCLGDGGAVLTNQAGVAKRLRMLRDGGRRGGQVSYVTGINSRLDEMQCCYLRAFLPSLEEWNADRARTAASYDVLLSGCEAVRRVGTNGEAVHHLYVIRAARRNRLREHLAKKGIGTGVHYPVPLHLMPAFRDSGLRRGDLPHAEKACREIVSLPLWPYMPESMVQYVAEQVRAFYRS
ncbi:MAG: DegT/DnrJ/EryC1/StrS family aminotransferase [Acidimicrobiia bacterium]|nr:DegT/DnrJ/EryC1/StrS family aminotransferase [Acidimicrobiia bacterium]